MGGGDKGGRSSRHDHDGGGAKRKSSRASRGSKKERGGSGSTGGSKGPRDAKGRHHGGAKPTSRTPPPPQQNPLPLQPEGEQIPPQPEQPRHRHHHHTQQQGAYQPYYPQEGGMIPEVEPNPNAVDFELETLQDCKRLWLEYTRHTLSVFAKNSYEYNIYESKKNRFLIASPAKGGQGQGRKRSQPTEFSVHAANGTEIFNIKWRPGTCLKPGMLIELFSGGAAIGKMHSEQKNVIARTPQGIELLRVTGVPVLNICNQRGPDSFRCEIFITEKSITDSMGIVGRNGAIMESVVAGEPSAFYFVAAKTPKNEFTLLQKQFILALLVVFMTQYAE